MAGYPPPPYNPQAGPRPPYIDPRDQARFLRDQARAQAQAQKAAFRAQRDLYREQNRSLRRRSILGPLLVLAIGTVALLVSIGKLPFLSLAYWYARWWPLLIVAAGLMLIGEWALDQWSTHEGTPYVRRGLGGGTIFLLIMLMFLGLTARSVHNHGDFWLNGLSINPDNIDEVFGQKYDREQQLDQAFAPGTSLAVSNPHGDVTITGSSPDNQIHVTVNKQVYSSSEDLANDKANRLSPRMELSGGVLNLSMPSMDGAVSDLNIAVPKTALATVSADHGNIRVSAMQAAVNVTSNRGDIDLDNVTANVSAHINSSHASFAAHGITGDVAVHGRADNVNLTQVSGLVTLEGEFYGDTHLEHLTGPVSFHTSRTYLSMGSLAGQIDISPESELSGNQLSGPTELRTRSRNISLQHVTGSVAVTNTNGTVDLADVAPLGGINVQNKNGAVSLSLPDHAGVSVEASTHDGHIESDLALQPISGHDGSELRGIVGDGATKISIQTSHGDISIHK